MVGTVVEKGGHYYVEWTIEDFTLESVELDQVWYSSKFYFLNVSWHLCLYTYDDEPDDDLDDSTEWIGLNLVREESSSDVREVSVFFTLGLKATDGTLYKPQSTTHSFIEPGDYYGWYKLVEREEFHRVKDKFWPANMITISCDIRLERERLVDAESQTPSGNDFTVLSQDFKNLFSSGENADITIKVKNSTFCVHSQIVAARSPVFAAMLKHEMKEKRTGTIDIPDCDPGAFKVLLMFLYSGQPDGLSAENAMHLYIAADKYNIINLKKSCVDLICQNMSEEKVCDVISLAVIHNDRELLAHGTEFFVNNVEKLFQTVKWMSFIKEHPIEANELIIKAFKYLSPQ